LQCPVQEAAQHFNQEPPLFAFNAIRAQFLGKGAGHFTVLTHDLGRCAEIGGIPPQGRARWRIRPGCRTFARHKFMQFVKRHAAISKRLVYLPAQIRRQA